MSVDPKQRIYSILQCVSIESNANTLFLKDSHGVYCNGHISFSSLSKCTIGCDFSAKGKLIHFRRVFAWGNC